MRNAYNVHNKRSREIRHFRHPSVCSSKVLFTSADIASLHENRIKSHKKIIVLKCKCKSRTYLKTQRSNLLCDIARIITQWFYHFPPNFHPSQMHMCMVCFSFRNKRAKQLLFITVFFLILRRVYAFISHFIYSYLLYLWLYFPENLNTKSLSEETMEYLANVNHRII